MAINLQRAERRTDEFLTIIQATGQTVAPGSYNLPASITERAETVAPFNSLQERSFQHSDPAARSPGPGDYELRSDGFANIAGLSSVGFKSASRRMCPIWPGSTVYKVSSIVANPGPGTYDPPPSGSPTRQQKELIGRTTKPVLEVRDKTIPSIPLLRFQPGHVPETEAARADAAVLCARHTGKPDDLVGPGEYDPITTLQRFNTGQTVFHRTSKDRQLWDLTVNIESATRGLPRDVPGPGAYDVDRSKEKPDVEKMKTSQFASESKRPYQQRNDDPKKVMPGPGHYDVLNQTIGKAVEQLRVREAAIQGGSKFGSATERVGWYRSLEFPFTDAFNSRHVPGPGFYLKEDGKALPESLRKKKCQGVHHPSIVLAIQDSHGPIHGFNSTDDRPCNKQLTSSTPSPAEYSLDNGLSLTADLREKAKVGRKGVFGSCADRFFGSPLSGPAGEMNDDFGSFPHERSSSSRSRSLSPQVVESENRTARSAFASKTQRFKQNTSHEAFVTPLGKHRSPAPGTYDVMKVPNYSSPFRVPKQDHLSFGSSRGRFQGEELDGSSPQAQNPGPGHYDTPRRGRIPGAPLSSVKRDMYGKSSTDSKVGPGTYGSIETTLLKKSFNVTTVQAFVTPGTPRAPRAPRTAKGSTIETAHSSMMGSQTHRPKV